MPKALITGVSGQTGSYLAENLLARGWEVHGVQRDPSHEPLVPRAVTVHQADLSDFTGVARVVAEVEPDTTWNLAALSSVAASWARPIETAMLNGAAVANLLDAVHKLPEIPAGRGFVQASSAEIFGAADVSPQSETTPIRPVNPYGASKAYAHALTGAYRAAGLRASGVILYNHESPRRPETFVTRKITAGVARIVRGEQAELVLGNLDVKRDWGWAPDYAEALALVGASGAASRAVPADDYVVATGESHTIRDFVAAAFAAAGVAEWEHLVRVDEAFVRPTDATEMRGDATKITRALGWAPTKRFADVVAAMVENDLRS